MSNSGEESLEEYPDFSWNTTNTSKKDEVFDLKDPDEILASRRKEEELLEMLAEARLGIPLQSALNKPQGDSITSDPHSLRQSEETQGPQIIPYKPGRLVFDHDKHGCCFTFKKEIKTLADFLPLNMSTEFSDKILNWRLDKVIQNLSLGKKHCPTIAHQVCQAVYCYMSVARGSRLLRTLRRIPPLYSLGWRPHADNLLAVFKNWGASLDLRQPGQTMNILEFSEAIETSFKQNKRNELISNENIEMVLIHMSSSLPFISARGGTDVDALLSALVLASLDPLILISFNMTLLKQNIRALIDNIPEQDWGPDKIVSFACTLLDLDSHLHNLCAVSMMFVEMDGRSKEVGLCLSVHLIKLMLATLLPSHKVVASSCNLATVGDTNNLPTKGGASFSTLACSSNEFLMDHSANVSSLVHNLNDFNMVDESNHLKKVNSANGHLMCLGSNMLVTMDSSNIVGTVDDSMDTSTIGILNGSNELATVFESNGTSVNGLSIASLNVPKEAPIVFYGDQYFIFLSELFQKFDNIHKMNYYILFLLHNVLLYCVPKKVLIKNTQAAQNLIAVFKTFLQNLPNDFMCTDTSTLKSMITRTIMTWNDFLQMGTCGYHGQ